MPSHLIVPVRISPPSVVRRKRHVAQSLLAVDRLLEEIGAAPDPVLALAGSLSKSGEQADGVRQDWAELVRAHALDLYADAGRDAMAWPHALGEALHMLVRMRRSEKQWTVRVPGLVLEILPEQSPDRPITAGSAGKVRSPSLLTMEEVDLHLRARSADQAWKDAEELCDLLPDASLPHLALATGALQALAIAGDLSGFDRMTMGDARVGWIASVHWPQRALATLN